MLMMQVMMMMSYLGGMSVLLTAAVGVERQHWWTDHYGGHFGGHWWTLWWNWWIDHYGGHWWTLWWTLVDRSLWWTLVDALVDTLVNTGGQINIIINQCATTGLCHCWSASQFSFLFTQTNTTNKQIWETLLYVGSNAL